MEPFWERVRTQAMSGEGIGREDALAVLSLGNDALWRLLDATESVRRRFKGDGIRLCSIVNAKSGQSAAGIGEYPLLSGEEIFREAAAAKERGAREFSIVASGLAMRNREELTRVGDAVDRIRTELGLETCVSLGTLPPSDVEYLLSRGL